LWWYFRHQGGNLLTFTLIFSSHPQNSRHYQATRAVAFEFSHDIFMTKMENWIENLKAVYG